MVYLDSSPNCLRESGEEVIARVSWDSYRTIGIDQSGSDKGVRFKKNAAYEPSVAFDPKGLAVTDEGGMGNGSVYLKNKANRSCRIVVSGGGRIRIES